MDDAEEQLLDTLNNTIDEYQSLVQLLEDKQQVLLDRDVDALEEVTEKEKHFVNELKRLESDRESLWNELLPPDTDRDAMSLDRLLEHVSEATAEQLQSIRVDLKQVVREVRQLNEENTLLLENRISVFDQIFDMITGEEENNNQTYGPDSETEEQSTRSARLVDEAI